MKKNNSYLILGALCLAGAVLIALDYPIVSAPFFAGATYWAWHKGL
ncbi:MAG: hypothetical protein NBV66_12830 [Burkholderiaceae bacterium]|nr:hypothetical protein [Burkholderiaceae bacterium]